MTSTISHRGSARKVVLCICGSLQRGSLNTRLLEYAQSYAPAGMEFVQATSLGGLPHFNEDLESLPPAQLVQLREQVDAANGLLIATPGYNASLSGALKNPLDWLSRPLKDGRLCWRRSR
jgi:chromate reductase